MEQRAYKKGVAKWQIVTLDVLVRVSKGGSLQTPLDST